MQLPLDQRGVNDRDDAHHGRAEGNGDGDGQQGRQDALGTVGPVPDFYTVPHSGLDKIQNHIDQRENRPHGHAGDGPGRGQMGFPAHVHDPIGQPQPHAELAHGLQDLGHRGRGHASMALGVAPEGGQTAHTDHRRRQSPDALGGQGVVHQPRKLVRPEVHHQKGDDSQPQEHPQGQAEHLPHLAVAAQGPGLGHHLGHRHRQARRGDGQQNGVDVIGVVEVGHALGAYNLCKGKFVKQADDFRHHDAHRQDGGAAEKRISPAAPGGLLLLCHRRPPIQSLPPKIWGRA